MRVGGLARGGYKMNWFRFGPPDDEDNDNKDDNNDDDWDDDDY